MTHAHWKRAALTDQVLMTSLEGLRYLELLTLRSIDADQGRR